jgi:hypothetical protein
MALTLVVDADVTSYLISELLHEVVKNFDIALNRGICFFENVLAKSFPCAELSFR